MVPYKDGTIQVQGVCVKRSDESDKKFFYPIVMTVSAAFLLLAVLVYTFYPKVMDGNVAHLRRHFALNMLVAMLIQILRGFGVIQKEKNNVACPAIGKED